MEKAGFVRRERDESDRRKVFIALVPERLAEIGGLYELLQRAMQRQTDAYTDAELKLISRYATESYRSILDATNQLKAKIEEKPKKKARRD